MQITDKISITNEDNILLMARYPDKYFDLAIVDPPYGIDIMKLRGKKRKTSWKHFKSKDWDTEIPNQEYFNELIRVSKNQIIWGGNYFVEFLKPSMGWIFWDKNKHDFSTSDGELAFSSFKCKLRVFKRMVNEDKGFMNKEGGDIHPTQKPVALYNWLLDRYAKAGDKILDTHLGSGSIAIACHDYGFELTACELDEEYYNLTTKRIQDHVSQLKLF